MAMATPFYLSNNNLNSQSHNNISNNNSLIGPLDSIDYSLAKSLHSAPLSQGNVHHPCIVTFPSNAQHSPPHTFTPSREVELYMAKDITKRGRFS
jgi:hypothetical protein